MTHLNKKRIDQEDSRKAVESQTFKEDSKLIFVADRGAIRVKLVQK